MEPLISPHRLPPSPATPLPTQQCDRALRGVGEVRYSIFPSRVIPLSPTVARYETGMSRNVKPLNKAIIVFLAMSPCEEVGLFQDFIQI